MIAGLLRVKPCCASGIIYVPKLIDRRAVFRTHQMKGAGIISAYSSKSTTSTRPPSAMDREVVEKNNADISSMRLSYTLGHLLEHHVAKVISSVASPNLFLYLY